MCEVEYIDAIGAGSKLGHSNVVTRNDGTQHTASTSPRGGGSLVVAIAARDGYAVRTFRFDAGDSICFGREDSDVIVDDTACSRRHFEISNADGKCILRDVESSNGTHVNGRKVQLKVLKSGDEVRAGTMLARVGGNLTGSAPQVMVELRGLNTSVPELQAGSDASWRAEPTIVRGRAVGEDGAPPEPSSAGPVRAHTFLPGVWQVCEAAFDEPHGPPKLGRFVEAVRSLSGADRVAMVKKVPDRDDLVFLAVSKRENLEPPLPILPELVEGCRSLGAAISAPDVRTDRIYLSRLGEDKLCPAGVVYVSVASLDNKYGVLYAEWREPVDFAPLFMWTWSVASQLGLLIERNTFAAAMRRAKEDLEGTVAERTQELATAVKRLTATQQMMNQAGKLATIGELASGIVHELRNPLTAILGYVDLIGLEQQGIKNEKLEVIRQQATRALRIVKNLLSFARRDDPKQAEVKLGTVLEEAKHLVDYEVRRYGASLVFEIPDNLPGMLADKTQIEHVFINLIANACHAVDGCDNRAILVRAESDEGRVRIRVEDSGKGIPADALEHIFEPFFTTKPVGSGTGLGLSISKSMIESQGGTITAANRPGGGAVFEMSLPIAGTAFRRAVTADEADRGLPRSVLFVDDEPDICSFCRTLFTRVGCDVSIAGTARQALTILQERDFDLLITDYNLPDKTGIELFETAKGLGRDFTGKVLFISGTSEAYELLDSVHAAHGKFLPKPFNASRILSIVREIVRGE